MNEEELMALLSAGVVGQPQGDDFMRRRRLIGDGSGGMSGGVGGPEQSLSGLLAFLMGTPFPNLAGLPSGMDLSGLSQDYRMGIGGPNVAPGSPSGTATNQGATPTVYNPAQPGGGSRGGGASGDIPTHQGDTKGGILALLQGRR